MENDQSSQVNKSRKRKTRKVLTLEDIHKIQSMVNQGLPTTAIASSLDSTISNINRIKSKIDYCEDNEIPLEKMMKKGGRKPVEGIPELHTKLLAIVQNGCVLTQKGMLNKLENYGLRCSQATVSRILKANKISRKRLRIRNTRTINQDIIDSRKVFASELTTNNINLLYLDVAGFNLHSSKNYGYSPSKCDRIGLVSTNTQPDVSLVAIINCREIVSSKLVEGEYNTQQILDFLNESWDESSLQSCITPNETRVIVNKERFHQSDEIKVWMNDRGITLMFLPPNSPQLSPIEEVFSAIKAHYRTLRPLAQDSETIKRYVSQAISSLNQDDSFSIERFYVMMRKFLDLALNGGNF
ncbi:hypothetical protein RF11_14415 [Thelohanellus kitauei]|uniref:Tc1-like transposase DDE domain-containing protein n=1 Tax=Thelohanellus kitauei TaxID=669202 RepID=A0A0C2IIS3_THEKT|nr:hypothetical protein RF11_14415 [Thelohanellus kitauei]